MRITTSCVAGTESIIPMCKGRSEPEKECNSNEHCVMGEVDACMPQATVNICTCVQRCGLWLLFLISIIVNIILGVKHGLSSVSSPATIILSCPSGWNGYGDRCYYFSDNEGTWNFSQSNCSAYGASLATIENEMEMRFIMRYKGSDDHWIGLWREKEDQPWKWTNGSQFNNWFEIRANGLCAYLDDDSARSTWCKTDRKWICSKPLSSSPTKLGHS